MPVETGRVMLIIVDAEIKPQVGMKFFRYYARDSYDKGEITKVDSTGIEVDFGDTVYAYECEICSVVFNAAHEEHIMSFGGGRLVSDMRPKHNIPVNADDLLDFSWMSSPIPD